MRTLPAGDPSKFVWWRYMPITDPETGELYLNRLYIFRTPWGGLMKHNIAGADWGRDLHSHPWQLGSWSFLTLVARGGYEEEVAEIVGDVCGMFKCLLAGRRTRIRKARRIYAFRADEVHRISAVKPKTVTFVWSFPKPKNRTWGFWIEDENGFGRIQKWSEYLDQYGRDGAR